MKREGDESFHSRERESAIGETIAIAMPPCRRQFYLFCRRETRRCGGLTAAVLVAGVVTAEATCVTAGGREIRAVAAVYAAGIALSLPEFLVAAVLGLSYVTLSLPEDLRLCISDRRWWRGCRWKHHRNCRYLV
ncbi:uncharacterized protein LOC110264265 isoform X1 [Arachis ipaensis]|uniref:uncharacterized protein LOC110264265 isoform X1 n=1 Tax=Arachis ipaensis TaxID=130454 RepID=UPI000A2B7D7B|nr:uncharacterized protein LOC110264265 isoform X1 [Arachis ipaensis]